MLRFLIALRNLLAFFFLLNLQEDSENIVDWLILPKYGVIRTKCLRNDSLNNVSSYFYHLTLVYLNKQMMFH